jgi:hypothetical protein
MNRLALVIFAAVPGPAACWTGRPAGKFGKVTLVSIGEDAPVGYVGLSAITI